jgi:periplasmic protein TonB
MKNLFFLLLFQYGIAFAQMPDSTLCKAETKSISCVFVTEARPEFPGGEKALLKFMEENLIYPKGVCGVFKVFLSFTIEKDGSITGIKVLRSYGEAYSTEAIKVVEKMPKWIPAKSLDNQPVRCRYTLPIFFK